MSIRHNPNWSIGLYRDVWIAAIASSRTSLATLTGVIYIIKEKLETVSAMESYLPTSDRHAASWIFSDGPSKQLGVVKLRYNALKLFFIMSLFYANVPVSASDSHSRQFLKRQDSFAHSASTSVEISPYWQL